MYGYRKTIYSTSDICQSLLIEENNNYNRRGFGVSKSSLYFEEYVLCIPGMQLMNLIYMQVQMREIIYNHVF